MMRKIVITATLSIMAFCVSVHAQSPSNNARQNYNRIEKNLKNYTIVKTDLPNESAEGGELIAYFERGAVRKIVSRHYGEMGRAIREFYFAEGRLFFVLHTEMHYDEPLAKVVKREQNRYYFSAGKLTRWVDENAKTRAASDEWFKSNELIMLYDARRLLVKAKALLD